MNIKIKNQNGEWVEAAYTLDGDNLLIEPKFFIPQNGDVVVCEEYGTQIMICKSYIKDNLFDAHVFFDTMDGEFRLDFVNELYFTRRATEEEKKLLFDKMEEEGYEWDTEKMEVRKKRWKPELNETYYYPSFWGRYFSFSPASHNWHGYDSDERLFNAGWCFKTKEDCQAVCDKINEAIKKAQLCESNDTK